MARLHFDFDDSSFSRRTLCENMFSGCTSLKKINLYMPQKYTSDGDHFTNWVLNVAERGDFYYDTEYEHTLDISQKFPFGVNGIPSGWRTYNIYEHYTNNEYTSFLGTEFLITSGSNSSKNGRGDITKKSTITNMEKSFDENGTHQMNTYNIDSSYNQEIWGYKSFNGPVKFRNGIYGECASLITLPSSKWPPKVSNNTTRYDNFCGSTLYTSYDNIGESSFITKQYETWVGGGAHTAHYESKLNSSRVSNNSTAAANVSVTVESQVDESLLYPYSEVNITAKTPNKLSEITASCYEMADGIPVSEVSIKTDSIVIDSNITTLNTGISYKYNYNDNFSYNDYYIYKRASRMRGRHVNLLVNNSTDTYKVWSKVLCSYGEYFLYNVMVEISGGAYKDRSFIFYIKYDELKKAWPMNPFSPDSISQTVTAMRLPNGSTYTPDTSHAITTAYEISSVNTASYAKDQYGTFYPIINETLYKLNSELPYIESISLVVNGVQYSDYKIVRAPVGLIVLAGNYLYIGNELYFDNNAIYFSFVADCYCNIDVSNINQDLCTSIIEEFDSNYRRVKHIIYLGNYMYRFSAPIGNVLDTYYSLTQAGTIDITPAPTYYTASANKMYARSGDADMISWTDISGCTDSEIRYYSDQCTVGKIITTTYINKSVGNGQTLDLSICISSPYTDAIHFADAWHHFS